MLEVIVTSTLALIQEITPALSTATMVGKVIDSLSALVPALIREYRDLIPTVKNAIATLRGNTATTSDQLDQLDTIEAKLDSDFDAADTAAQAEDDAAKGV